MNTDISTITKAILSSTNVPENIVQMAYELGISHGRSQLAEERKKPRKKEWTWYNPADHIATTSKLRSGLEARWFPYLVTRYPKVAYEPKRFPCFSEGKRTHYTPDFRCMPATGNPVWIETKSPKWRALNGWNASSDMRQLRRMQSVVKHHRIYLYVVSGEPDGEFKVYQVLGLDVEYADAPSTLVEVKPPWQQISQ